MIAGILTKAKSNNWTNDILLFHKMWTEYAKQLPPEFAFLDFTINPIFWPEAKRLQEFSLLINTYALKWFQNECRS